MYYAPGATHAPLQAPKTWIDRFKGKFDMGWDKYREQALERQKKLGVVPADTVLTPSLLTRLLNTATLDRIYRCLTGSVAVSAYELSFLPLPDGRELARLVTLDDATFDSSVTRYYRDVVR